MSARSSVDLLDRREFIVATGATMAVTYLPFAESVAATPVGATTPRELLTDWTIDDMWGVYPRPSEPIGYGRPHGDGELLVAVHPVDLQFVA